MVCLEIVDSYRYLYPYLSIGYVLSINLLRYINWSASHISLLYWCVSFIRTLWFLWSQNHGWNCGTGQAESFVKCGISWNWPLFDWSSICCWVPEGHWCMGSPVCNFTNTPPLPKQCKHIEADAREAGKVGHKAQNQPLKYRPERLLFIRWYVVLQILST